jgi:flap endonuclease-1
MGIKSLNSIINKYAKNAIKVVDLRKYSNKRVAIDANLYLYKYLYGGNNGIDGIFFQINKLKKFNIEPIYVFDGKPPEEKTKTILNRRKNKEKLKKKISNLNNLITTINNNSDLNTYEKNLQISKINKQIKLHSKGLIYVTKNIINKVKYMLNIMGIKYIDAPCESEHFCCKLILDNLVDMILSEDMDTIACGADVVIQKYSNKKDYVLEYDFNKIMNEMKLNKSEFIDLCILCGNDYVQRIKGFNQFQIYEIISKYKNIEEINSKKGLLVKYNYQKLRDIYNLKNIETSEFIDIINNPIKENLKEIYSFMDKNSNINKYTYKKRINLMYSKNNYIYKNNYMKNLKKHYINKAL